MRAKRVGTSLLLSFAALEVSTGNIRPGWPITVNVCEVRNRGRNYNPSEAPATAVLRAFDYGGMQHVPDSPWCYEGVTALEHSSQEEGHTRSRGITVLNPCPSELWVASEYRQRSYLYALEAIWLMLYT